MFDLCHTVLYCYMACITFVKCFRLFYLHFHVPIYLAFSIQFFSHFNHSFMHSSISYSLCLSPPYIISPHLFFPHSHPISPYLTLTLPFLTLPHPHLSSPPVSSPSPSPSPHPHLTLTLTAPQLVHMRPLSAPLWTMRTVLAEYWTLSSATSTVEGKRNITATSTKTTSRHLGSSPPSYSYFYSNSHPTSKAWW